MNNKIIILKWITLSIVCFITACGGGGKDLSGLLGGSINIKPSSPKIVLSDTEYDYGGIVLKYNADREFTISNTGIQEGLEVSGITSDTDEFTITGENCTSKPMAINEACTFIARFTPKVQGAIHGKIAIDFIDQSTRTISLTGTGYGLNVWINQADFSDCSDAVVYVTVIDPDGPIGSLNIGEHFTLWQNDRKQEITSISPIESPDPVSLVLAIDLSGSLVSVLTEIKTHAKYFIEQLGDADEAAIYKFQSDIINYPSSGFVLTDAAGKADLESHIDSPDPVVGGTALYDAIYDSITRAATGTYNKKAVIVLSDGHNVMSPTKTLEEVMEYANQQKVPVFTIYYVDPVYQSDAKPAIMRQIAAETMGQDYYTDVSTMEDIFKQISYVLGSKYTIHYTPTMGCSESISLKVRADWNDGSNDLYGIDVGTYAP